MIDLYTWTTPNGRKISIMLEEVGLEYAVKPVDLSAGAQRAPQFLALSPNNKVPAIVDHDAGDEPMVIFESAAILTYLAEKTGQLLALSGAARYRALQWMAWQMSAIGPTVGQIAHFSRLPEGERNPAALARFSTETGRLLRVLEKRLGEAPYLGGEAYSIADIATYPWVAVTLERARAVLPEDVRALPATTRWIETIGARPAVQRGMAVPAVSPTV